MNQKEGEERVNSKQERTAKNEVAREIVHLAGRRMDNLTRLTLPELRALRNALEMADVKRVEQKGA